MVRVVQVTASHTQSWVYVGYACDAGTDVAQMTGQWVATNAHAYTTT